MSTCSWFVVVRRQLGFAEEWLKNDGAGLIRSRSALAVALGVAMVFRVACGAQEYVRDFHNRNVELRNVQPTWVTPLIGTTPLLGQFQREEFIRQKLPRGAEVWNVGSGKGPSLLPTNRVEVDLSVPNYAVHSSPDAADGFGDFCATVRYRIFSGAKGHGNYAITAVGSQSWPTGSGKNGAVSSTRGITLAGGKAFGRYAVLSTVGATLPAQSGLRTLGRPMALNSAFEAHLRPRLWAQLESNTTFFHGGTHDGAKQHFLTPGLFLVPLRPWSAESKSYILLGAGMQFATSRYHASDHNLVIDTKFYF